MQLRTWGICGLSAVALSVGAAPAVAAGGDLDGYSVKATPSNLQKLAKAGFDPVFGARPLKREIQRRIENPVAKLILEGRFGPKDVIPVDMDGGEFSFSRVVH